MISSDLKTEPVWNEDLICNWFGLLVPAPGQVVLLIKPLNATDMSGAIKVARAVMADVNLIVVAAAGTGEIDVSYHLKDGEWEAMHPRKGAVLQDSLRLCV